MDNFRKPKRNRISSLDGFVKPNEIQKNKNGLHAFNQYYNNVHDQSRQVQSSDRIDDFKGQDGFTPAEQTPITRPADPNKPYELGSVAVKAEDAHRSEGKAHKTKKRRFSLIRKKSKPAGHPLQHKSKHHKLKLGLKVSGALAAVIILVAGGLGLKAFLKARNIFKGGSEGAVALNKDVDPTLLKGEGDGRVNILLLGKGGEGHTAPDLTDTLLVASIDPIAKEAALLSVPRDLWVKSSASGYQSKINEVYANAKYGVLNSYTTKQQTDEVKANAEKAGIDAISDTLSGVIGIPLHYYMMVDFEAFRQAIDAVGGIDVNVKTQLYDPTIAWENNNNALIAAVGTQHFDGKKALLYARSRQTSARGDFDRAERQRDIITALKTKVLSAGTFANPLKVNQLIDAFGDHVSTDFSLDEIMRVYDISKDIASDKIASLGLDEYVHGEAMRGQSAQVPKAGTFDYSAIQNFVRNSLKDAFLKSENASVVILNGTDTTGLATLKSNELKSFGYNVTQVGDAPTKDYSKTVLVDLTNGSKKYTKTYLEKRLNVGATTSLPDSTITATGADFVIILGSNESSAL